MASELLMKNTADRGEQMYQWASDLFPICRSITGDGVRKTLNYLQNLLPDLTIKSVASGTQVFDWQVPQEWNIKEAFIEDLSGNRVIDFKNHNLHILGYSTAIDQIMSFEELDQHLYSLPEQADAIPFITSYYKKRWGFCLKDKQRQTLRLHPEQQYRVKIDSSLEDGQLNYGELIIKGETEQEILLSTYVCHPSMANNELSGPIVAASLAQWIQNELSDRRYTYRILFLVETIGAITYLSQHLETMKRNTIAGFVLTCVGDNRCYSFVESRLGNTLADRIAKHVLAHHASNYKHFSFLERGSDERQYCSPGVDLPVCSICRSKYDEYPEYHTSLDDLSLISPEGLEGSFTAYQKCIEILEKNQFYHCTSICEPQLGKRGLYPNVSTKDSAMITRNIINLLAYSDGNHDLIMIADKLGVDASTLIPTLNQLLEHNILKV